MAEAMNYIDRLVAELCPDGVDFYTIDELITLDFGTRITKSKDAGTIYPVYGGGGASFRTDNYNREDKYVVSRFAMSEKCVRYVSGKFWMLDSGFTYSVKDESLLSYKYISYWLLNAQQEIYACSSQSAQRNLKTAEFKRFEVPVPPMEIQEAIVEILDKFTNLEAELEAELEARTLQYEYYRDSLFEALDCPRVPLGELGKFYGGLKGKTKNDFGSSGARYISYKNVYENISADFTWPDFVQVKEGENQLSLMKGDILLTGSSENMEESGLSSVVTKEPEEKAYLNSFSICYRLNDPSILNPEFSKYLFRSRLARKQIIRTAQGVTRFNVSKKKLANVSIPIPSLEEQQRIVDILDRFDALTSSLSEGLPAELAARRSQYEYYRDQLLSFPRKGENQ